MDGFWQGISLALVGTVAVIVLGRNRTELSLVLITGVVAMVAVLALSYLSPVADLLYRLQTMSGMDNTFLKTLFKAAGVAIVTEIAQMICMDAGNASLGKTIQLLGTATMLYLALPLIDQLLDLIENVMNNL